MRTTINKYKIDKLSIDTLFDAKTKSSFCWRYFGDLIVKEDGKKKHVLTDQVFCNACLSDAQNENDDISFGLANIKSYAKTVSTGNLNRHLRDVHSIKEEVRAAEIIKDFFTAQSQLQSKATGSSSKLKNKDTIARDIALWYCRSLMPLDSVSDEGMTDFFLKYKIISTREDMPTREIIIRTALDDLYKTTLNDVKAQIAADDAKHAAVTVDLWTDQRRHLDYVTFTLHYLTTDFEHKSFTLCTKLMEGKKTGEKIQDMFQEVIEDFALQEKKLHCVFDGGLEAKRAIRFSRRDNHLCLGHGLHNLVTDDGIRGVPEIDALITKCKQIVKAIQHNMPELEKDTDEEQNKFINLLEQVFEHLETDENEPIAYEDQEIKLETEAIDEVMTRIHFGSIHHMPSITTRTRTRWQSVLDVLECLAHFDSKNPVNKMLSQGGHEELKISKQEWYLLQEFVKFLRKFRDVVEMLSSPKMACLNLAIVFQLEIKDILNSLSDEASSTMLKLKHKMLSQIDTRFPITDKIVVAAMLDPKFICLSQIDLYLERKNTTRAEFLAKYLTQPQIESEAPASSSGESLLLKLSKIHGGGPSNLDLELDAADEECRKYLANAAADNFCGDDILMYWREKKSTFPKLGELARVLLAIPATSTQSERIFSQAGLVLNAKRCQLSPAHVNKMIFIHDNYHFCAKNLQ